MLAKDLQMIQGYADSVDGVLTLPDLRVLYASRGEPAIYKKLSAFVREGILVKVKRGIYATPSASLDAICARIAPGSYITAGTVLARALLIGSIPGRRIQAAKTGRPRRYSCKLGTIEYLSLKPSLLFGFTMENGVNYACPEKAFLDACYFFFKGRRFSFDLGEDVDTSTLDRKLLSQYLQRYDKKFASFFRKTWRIV